MKKTQMYEQLCDATFERYMEHRKYATIKLNTNTNTNRIHIARFSEKGKEKPDVSAEKRKQAKRRLSLLM